MDKRAVCDPAYVLTGDLLTMVVDLILTDDYDADNERLTLATGRFKGPTTQTFRSAAQRRCALERINRRWNTHVRGHAWTSLCRREFPWAENPSRETYVRWTRLMRNAVATAGDSLPISLPSDPDRVFTAVTDRVPSVLVVIHHTRDDRHSEVVYHTVRPFSERDRPLQPYDPAFMSCLGRDYAGSICSPVVPEHRWHEGMEISTSNLNFHAKCPPLPSIDAVRAHAQQHGFDVNMTLDTEDDEPDNWKSIRGTKKVIEPYGEVMSFDDVQIVVDTFLVMGGQIAHFERFEPDLENAAVETSEEDDDLGWVTLKSQIDPDTGPPLPPPSRRRLEMPDLFPPMMRLRPDIDIDLGILSLDRGRHKRRVWIHRLALSWTWETSNQSRDDASQGLNHEELSQRASKAHDVFRRRLQEFKGLTWHS